MMLIVLTHCIIRAKKLYIEGNKIRKQMKVSVCIMLLFLAISPIYAAQSYTNAIGIHAYQGNRESQEDSYFYEYIRSEDKSINEGHLLGVLDGYNGNDIAHQGAITLPVFFKSSTGDVVHKFESAFITYDNSCAQMKKKQCGAMATAVFIKENMLYFAQLGTTRAAVEKNKKIDFITQKHVPNDEDEKSRIESVGGHVIWYNNAWRVEGWLSASRSFGGHFGDMKKYVIAEPTCTQYALTPENKYLVLATGEFWKVMDNEKVLSVLHDTEKQAAQKDMVAVPRMLAWYLVEEARKKDVGNLTVMIVDLLLLSRSNCAQNVR